MKVTYICHSSFLLETDLCYYLFDYYMGTLPPLHKEKPLFLLFSHSHHDHYNPDIFSMLQELQKQQVYTVLSDDISPDTVPEGIDYMRVAPRSIYTLSLGQQLTTYPSTDQGVAFLIEEGETLIYHAGDLNDWVWEEETREYNEQMTLQYRKQIDALADHLGGRSLNCAFVVLDPRQEEEYDRGMLYFLEKVNAQKVYPMHDWGKSQIITQFLEEHPQYKDIIQRKDGNSNEI